MLERIARAIDAAGLDFECNFKGDGVLEIESDDGAKIIVNRHGAAQEIWVAAASGGFHFRVQSGVWKDTRDATSLQEKLSALLGTPIDF